MKYVFGILLTIMLLVPGCESQHAKNKQAALERWHSARAELNLNLADQQFKTGDLKKAAATAEAILAIEKDNLAAWLLLGKIRLEQNRIDQAQQCFQHSLQLNPQNAAAQYGLGVVFEKYDQPEQALEYYQQAWQFAPQNIPYVLALAETYVRLDRSDEALNILNKAMHAPQRSAAVYLLAGAIYSSHNAYDKATEMYNHAYRLSPGDEQITEALAFSYYRQGQAVQALPLLQELSRNADPQSQSRWVYELAIGDCQLQLGRYHEAQRCFEQITQQNVVKPAVWVRLAQTALLRQDFSRAETCAQRALGLEPDNIDAIAVLGHAAFKQGRYEPARKYFEQVVRRNPQDPLGYCMLGQTYAAMGQTDLAGKYYRHALTLNPQDTLAASLLKKLDAVHIGMTTNNHSTM
ncbi:MAG: tetratricopeptide repeat protein [Sedimentisphaerales bacterium]|nr:tetratricopeptide repeat protein [Sedimentisphaerales bacterium]